MYLVYVYIFLRLEMYFSFSDDMFKMYFCYVIRLESWFICCLV